MKDQAKRTDIKFMKEALRLAARAAGRTSPDPMVGAVLVKNGRTIGSGYHGEVTTPHAEAWAIEKAAERHGHASPRGATLYVNLEPCCFFWGKNNPPCSSTIIKAGIKRVVVAMQDPNPSVSGKGFAELKKAGIHVEVGLLEEEAKRLNEIFIKYITTGLPFVFLKSAMSLDGKIATKKGESFWISGPESRKRAHHLRNIVDAVLVGINTIVKDDPRLTVRDIKNKAKNPLKIILDPKARIPLRAKVLQIEPENAIIVVSSKAPGSKIKKIEEKMARVLKIKNNKNGFDMPALMKELGKRKITSVLVEGGGTTNSRCLEAGVVDKVAFFVAPKMIGGSKAPTPFEGGGIRKLGEAIRLKDMTTQRLGEDILIEGYILH
ncbi:MAG: bifunctional diaminohydroxyphosphoribosylaminopyrimidine deaminase/5-amino-6-(5-phosphoribosylamino)uracil reductase RibD [Candidatus Margulisbacteria bacterium]|nr:bifunctional diaminohydroxyphosphoribosylaminopyrimidine deaminase/5-amino-6-(5-phosphoribosylamino)uracil reductase RibD [Candidatus Margulisiibacteriota bacterium]